MLFIYKYRFRNYSVTLLSTTRLEILRIIGSKTGLTKMPKIKNPSPNSIKIIIFVIKISGTMPPTVSRKESITYVNGKYGEIVWKNLGAVTTGNVPPPPNL